MEPFLPPRSDGTPRRIPVPILDPKTGCWIWQGSLSGGYGKIMHGGKLRWAHRFYYEEAKGPIPGNRQIHHTCSARACVNPKHMALMVPKDHGKLTPAAKLSIKQARRIRVRLANGERAYLLAEEYGVSQQTISNIKASRNWAEPVTCPNCRHRFDPYA